MSSDLSLVTPTTKRFGRKVSSTAKPSRRNSGFQASSTSGALLAKMPLNRCAVPTGTVDLPAMSEPLFV